MVIRWMRRTRGWAQRCVLRKGEAVVSLDVLVEEHQALLATVASLQEQTDASGGLPLAYRHLARLDTQVWNLTFGLVVSRGRAASAPSGCAGPGAWSVGRCGATLARR